MPETGEKDSRSLLKYGQEVILNQGGRGGLGNDISKRSTNLKPHLFVSRRTTGIVGVDYLELKLLADVWLGGFS